MLHNNEKKEKRHWCFSLFLRNSNHFYPFHQLSTCLVLCRQFIVLLNVSFSWNYSTQLKISFNPLTICIRLLMYLLIAKMLALVAFSTFLKSMNKVCIFHALMRCRIDSYWKSFLQRKTLRSKYRNITHLLSFVRHFSDLNHWKYQSREKFENWKHYLSWQLFGSLFINKSIFISIKWIKEKEWKYNSTTSKTLSVFISSKDSDIAADQPKYQ